jgi:hypothetical protein
MWIERERYKGNIRELIEATQLAVLIVVDGTKNSSDPAQPWWLKLSQYGLRASGADEGDGLLRQIHRPAETE